MIGNHPNLPEKVWHGEVELQCGDLKDIIVDAVIRYTTDGNSYALGECTFKRFVHEKKFTKDGKPFHEHIIIDITDSVSEFAVEEIFNQYIVNP